jgi:hypothetical protein
MKKCIEDLSQKKENALAGLLDFIHADLCGPMQIASPGGARYFMTCKDDSSCFTELYFLRSKDVAVSKFKGLEPRFSLISFLYLIYYSFLFHMLGMATNLRTRFNRGVEIF